MRQDVAAPSPAPDVSAAAVLSRARARLSFDLPSDIFDLDARPLVGDHRLAGDHRLDGLPPRAGVKPRAAAVLIPIIDRPQGATVLLTLRASGLRDHSGQIALPGGKIDPSDASPAATALREAQEEVGLDPGRVTPLGYLDPYLTGTGFLIIPTVALVREPVEVRANPSEVDDVFEVPLAFLMEASNHRRGRRDVNGQMRSFYVMSYLDRRIWGVTAGVIRNLYDRLYG